MPISEVFQQNLLQHILLNGQEVEYRVVHSKTASKLRIKVSLNGVQVVLPKSREPEEARSFLLKNETWVTEQLDRVKQLSRVRRPEKSTHGRVLLRGETLPIRVIRSGNWQGPNRVTLNDSILDITCGANSRTPLATSLENWLRKEARQSIEMHLADVVTRVKRAPNRVYIMGQRTKWGNCSALGNLSFNWRLIMAPDFVLRYIVTHEVVHLAIPDHSQRFWLTVQSLCQSSERARQWLAANGHKLSVNLETLFTVTDEAISVD
jgi:predicted metal-dependent hydrolase